MSGSSGWCCLMLDCRMLDTLCTNSEKSAIFLQSSATFGGLSLELPGKHQRVRREVGFSGQTSCETNFKTPLYLRAFPPEPHRMDFYRSSGCLITKPATTISHTITQTPQIASVGLIGSIERNPSGRKIHTVHLTARSTSPK